jgi:hypothetical protein
MDWIGAQFGGSVIGGFLNATCDWLISPEEIDAQFTNPTLMASRVVTAVRQDNQSTDLIDGFGFGLIEWSGKLDPQFGQPQYCPDVFRDSEMDWILRQVFMFPVGQPAAAITSVILDEQYMSKAKRRIETGNGILMVASNSSDSPGDTNRFSADVRCLIKE